MIQLNCYIYIIYFTDQPKSVLFVVLYNKSLCNYITCQWVNDCLVMFHCACMTGLSSHHSLQRAGVETSWVILVRFHRFLCSFMFTCIHLRVSRQKHFKDN